MASILPLFLYERCRDTRQCTAALVACNGFNGSANATGLGREPFPVDTAGYFWITQKISVCMASALAPTSAIGLWPENTHSKNLPVKVLLMTILCSRTECLAVSIGPGALIGGVLQTIE
jgi:hypothetical protein